MLKHSWDVLRGEGGDNSWGAMQVALDHVAEMPDTPLYSKVFFTDNFRFQYPPSALFALSAMLAVDPERVQINDVYDGAWPAINTVVGWVFIALTAVSVAALLEIGLAALQPRRRLAPAQGPARAGGCRPHAHVLSRRQGLHAGPDPGVDQRPVRARAARLGSGMEGIERGAHRRHQPHQAALRAVPGVGRLAPRDALCRRLRGDDRHRPGGVRGGVRARQPHRLSARALVPVAARRGLLSQSVRQRRAQPADEHLRPAGLRQPRSAGRTVPALHARGSGPPRWRARWRCCCSPCCGRSGGTTAAARDRPVADGRLPAPWPRPSPGSITTG